MSKNSPSPPPAPDYAGAAKQSQLSQMTSQNTPYGSLKYSADPNAPSGYQSTISLAPQAQQTLDTQLGLSNNMANLAQGQLGAVNQQYSQPMDLNSIQGVADKAYGAMTSRLDPQWAQRQQQFDAQMANQGIPMGSEAYNNASRDFNQARNDAYQQANLGAINTMPQTYQMALSQYEQPLNQFNAIRTGAQIQNPQFNTATPGANYMGAAQGQGQYAGNLYNQEMAQQNALTSGLFSLGGSLGAAAILSDRRLKSNIERVGTHRLGIGIYEYDILGQRQIGVMADEVERVKPEAVMTTKEGYKAVRYGML